MKFDIEGTEVEFNKKTDKRYGTWIEMFVDGCKVLTLEPYIAMSGTGAVVVESDEMVIFTPATFLGDIAKMDIVSTGG